MRSHILHHVPFELIGNIGSWLSEKGAETTETHFYESSHLPSVENVDLLIIMGGPMSVNAQSKFRWLIEEKAFIRKAVERGTPTLGICLGSQLIASAFGARVKRSAYAEHGWFDVEGVEAPTQYFEFPERFTPFHSHGETFDLPKGAVHLARSVACEHQAFQLGERTIGVQFHLESTPKSTGAIVKECGDEFPRGPYVRNGDELRHAPKGAYKESAALMGRVLEYLTR